MLIEDELIDRVNVWAFYYFAAATIVPLLEDFLDVADIKVQKTTTLYLQDLPENSVSAEDFRGMISMINLLVRYNNEGGLEYGGREINFERGDIITELLDALHKFVNLLPYLNDRHFTLSEERYEDAPNGRHCDFDELCDLDKTIARRIYPTLRAFAEMSIFCPKHFTRMSASYGPAKGYRRCDEWDLVLAKMVRSWKWILERTPKVDAAGWEVVPEKIYHGLHLFAEYLPEMQND